MQITIEQAVTAHRAGNLHDAEAIYRAILVDQPKHCDANHNLGVLLVSFNKLTEAIPLLRVALDSNPKQGEYWISYIDALIKDRQFDSAYSILEQGRKLGLRGKRIDVLSRQLMPYKKRFSNVGPSQADLNILLAHYQGGRFIDAESLALIMTKNYPKHQFGWKVLGVVLLQIGKLHESEIANQKAIALMPNDAEAYNNLGNTLRVLGRLIDAEASYQRSVELKPDFAAAYNNLGVIRKELGRFDEAEVCYRQAIRLKPDYAEAHNNLGVILQELSRLEEAEKSSRQAVKYMPDFAEAYFNLGVTLKELGRLSEALNLVATSQKIKPSISNKNLLVAILKNYNPKSWDKSLSEMVTAGLLEPWCRPSDLMDIACRLLKLEAGFVRILKQNDINLIDSFEKNYLESSALIRAMLISSPIADYELESFFIKLRQFFLQKALSHRVLEFENKALPAIYCYLAQQCFINEYVYFQTEDELDKSNQLLEILATAIKLKERIPESLVVAIACYIPLHLVPGAEKLLEQDWSTEVISVLKQQIQEPLEELRIRNSIPCLTSIENLISLDVKKMYEENPYPRWVRYPKEVNSSTLNSRIRELFPLSTFQPLFSDKAPDILVAGCGTGQHPIGTAQLIKGANVLAIDFSMASLSYAKRKTTELGLRNIEYAQADLLELRSLGRAFDLIESSGVLHHLENPFAGWQVLLSLLKPFGLMKLGFYSELARRDIIKVRNMIIKEGVGFSPPEIRNFRNRILELKDIDNLGFALRSSDFFSTSACRDLLFHVQEHRMTLPILAKFLQEHELSFLGFEIDSSVKRSYMHRFPNDPTATDLNNWHTYEQENPDTFLSMYQFWIQKIT